MHQKCTTSLDPPVDRVDMNNALKISTPGFDKPISFTGADAALQFINDAEGLAANEPLDASEQRALIRRIDLHIMPLICAVYFLQYVDKISISYASVMGIQEATGLEGNQFNWVASIFFFGQLVFEFLTIRLIQLFPLAKLVSINVMLWGVVMASLAACRSYAALLVCRFLLGALEAVVVPALVLYTSHWFPKYEQGFRVGIWYSASPAAQIFGGLFAYGVAKHVGGDANATLQGWQIIFLFLGLLTSLIGVMFFWVVPDSPATARFLSSKQKVAHIQRIRGNEQGIGSRDFKWPHVKEALTDSVTWLSCLWIFMSNITSSITTSFGTLLIKGMGFSSEESLLLLAPFGAVGIVALIGLTWLAMKTRQRLWWCIVGHISPIIGAILMATTNRVPALIGYYLIGSILVGWTTIIGLQSSNVAGSTKKVTVACLGTIAYTAGSIISPQTFQSKDAPRYLPAKISICIIYWLCVVDLYIMRCVLLRRNAKRDQEKRAAGDSYQLPMNHEFLDLTDFENKAFRYEL